MSATYIRFMLYEVSIYLSNCCWYIIWSCNLVKNTTSNSNPLDPCTVMRLHFFELLDSDTILRAESSVKSS